MKLRIFKTTTFGIIVENESAVIDIPPGTYNIRKVLINPPEGFRQALFFFTNPEEIGLQLKREIFATERHLESQGINVLILP